MWPFATWTWVLFFWFHDYPILSNFQLTVLCSSYDQVLQTIVLLPRNKTPYFLWWPPKTKVLKKKEKWYSCFPISDCISTKFMTDFARPCEGIYRSMSRMSLSLLLQQCSAYLVCLTWIVFVMGSRWPYSCCFVGCCLKDLFNSACSILM